MEAEVGLKIGPVKATFKGAVQLSNINAPESYTITGEGKEIKSLKGLEHCSSLLELNLPENQIEDLAPLKDLLQVAE